MTGENPRRYEENMHTPHRNTFTTLFLFLFFSLSSGQSLSLKDTHYGFIIWLPIFGLLHQGRWFGKIHSEGRFFMHPRRLKITCPWLVFHSTAVITTKKHAMGIAKSLLRILFWTTWHYDQYSISQYSDHFVIPIVMLLYQSSHWWMNPARKTTNLQVHEG